MTFNPLQHYEYSKSRWSTMVSHSIEYAGQAGIQSRFCRPFNDIG
ncbi:MAG: hypothetical protein AB2L14_34840 [Candidatus Xenobiia bacterium LiM19]